MNQDKLELRKKIKSRKPKFIRQASRKKRKLAKKWVRPRGIDSKLRLNLRGHRKSVEMGYGSPKQVRGLDSSGLSPVIVYNLKGLEGLNKDVHGIVVSSSVGMKNKVELLKKAKEVNLKVLNVKDVDLFIKNAQERFAKRKEEKKKAKKEKEDKRKELEKKAKEKEEKEKKEQDEKGKMSEEELASKIKEEEQKKKKEKDKALISKK